MLVKKDREQDCCEPAEFSKEKFLLFIMGSPVVKVGCNAEPYARLRLLVRMRVANNIYSDVESCRLIKLRWLKEWTRNS